MELNHDEYVMLQGKKHPLWKGVLRLAGESGLKKLRVRLIQAPAADNGGMAICEATAIFKSPDGQEREFVELGDCDGTNCGKMIAPHRVRMAATRAKGRALRDALGIGEALAEELGGSGSSVEPDPEIHDYPCSQCAADVPWDQVKASRRKFNSKVFCSKCAADFSDTGIVVTVKSEHFCDTCGDQVPENVAQISMQKFNRTLCVPHGRELLALEKARVPAGQIAAG